MHLNYPEKFTEDLREIIYFASCLTMSVSEVVCDFESYSGNKDLQWKNLHYLGMIAERISDLNKNFSGWSCIFPTVPWQEIELKWNFDLICSIDEADPWGVPMERCDTKALWETATVSIPKVLKNLKSICEAPDTPDEIGELPILVEFETSKKNDNIIHWPTS